MTHDELLLDVVDGAVTCPCGAALDAQKLRAHINYFGWAACWKCGREFTLAPEPAKKVDLEVNGNVE